MISEKLQDLLHQLSELTTAELSVVKTAVNEKLGDQLKSTGINGDLTEEEWDSLERGELLSCVKMVRARTGLGLADSKAYVDRARGKGRKPQTNMPASDIEDSGYIEDSGTGFQRTSDGCTLYCPRGCCDRET